MGNIGRNCEYEGGDCKRVGIVRGREAIMSRVGIVSRRVGIVSGRVAIMRMGIVRRVGME